MMQAKAPSILFSEMAPGPDFEDKFHRWYDEEHIPVRMACPGFASAQRYAREDGKGYLAVYEMANLGVMSSPAYKVVKEQPSELTAWMLKNVSGFTRYLCDETFERSQPGAFDPIDAPVLYAVSFTVPKEAEGEFDAWYEREHIPMLMACPDWLMVRRMRVADGVPEPYTHLALHYLADSRALASPEREKARQTEWRARLAANDWFKANYAVFRRHGPRQLGRG